jgi:hypothetical protein
MCQCAKNKCESAVAQTLPDWQLGKPISIGWFWGRKGNFSFFEKRRFSRYCFFEQIKTKVFQNEKLPRRSISDYVLF